MRPLLLSAILLPAASPLAVAQNLVVNGDFQTGALAPSTTVYTQSSTMQPPRTWNIVSFNTLHQAWDDFYDHTFGDGQGFFMVVNGNTTGVGPTWSQSINVTPHTDYAASAWFASTHLANPASIEFRLDGQPFGGVFVAPPTTGDWVQHTAVFDSGARSSVTFEIWDISGIGAGNDYAIDDIAVAVPEPAAMALVLLTLATYSAISRSRLTMRGCRCFKSTSCPVWSSLSR
jgi:hypothetical protein